MLAGEVVEVRGSTNVGTFRAYRKMPDAVPGMIAWPNTTLLTGPAPIVVDPGYQTQGDMLVGALATRDLAPADVATVVMTHLHSDHLSALQQLPDATVYVHVDELDTDHGRRQRGVLDGHEVIHLAGDGGEIRPGLRWIHTPGHAPGHVALLVDAAIGTVAIAGDTLGPDPDWFDRMDLPAGFPDREAHMEAFRRIRAEQPVLVIPGHNPPVRLRADGT